MSWHSVSIVLSRPYFHFVAVIKKLPRDDSKPLILFDEQRPREEEKRQMKLKKSAGRKKPELRPRGRKNARLRQQKELCLMALK